MSLAPEFESLLTKYKRLVEVACACCDVPELAVRITITWNSRFTARMGDAQWVDKNRTGRIRLSRPLWLKASIDEQVETVVHEACHIIADYKTGGRQSHGPIWRETMRRCGYARPRRCHSVDNEAIKARRQRLRVPARCGCPTPIFLSRNIARKILRGAKAVCMNCRQRIVGVVEPTPLRRPKTRRTASRRKR